ncbi:MAG: pyrroloquinoline quinone-dependent dehydrogenase, partial [Gemmatimonadota bacterium]
AVEAAGEDWPTHGGAYSNQRYSTLSQIDRENVSRLAPAWVHQTGVPAAFETTPLVVGNTMYLTTPESRVLALNAATGRKLWEFVPEMEEAVICCGPANRGVAAYGERVFVGTLDARLFALDHRSGEIEWETTIAEAEDGYSITMAPLAYDGKVLVGVSGGEYGIRGFVAAYDVDDGTEVWRFHTVPAPSDAPDGWWGEWTEVTPFGTPLGRDIGAEQERLEDDRERDDWERGGGGVWMTPAYSRALDRVYISVGNPSPDFAGARRPGDNLYTGSIVALDAGTGELLWFFQYLPHDRWNLSGGGSPVLVEHDGRRLVAHAGKTGWLYVVDARTGEPVLRSQNFVPQQNLFTPPSEEGTPMAPGALGGNASPIAFAPELGFAFVAAMHQPTLYVRRYTPFQQGRPWLGGTASRIPDVEAWGVLTAIDVSSGEIRWQRRTEQPLLGAPLATAGRVVFVGEGTGSFDAFDAETGRLLWRFPAGAGVHGGPVTYRVDGIQYVVVAAGGHDLLDTTPGDDIIAFALPERRAAAGYTPADYPAASYTRGEPYVHGAVRQVPARQLRPPTSADRDTGDAVRSPPRNR